MDPIYKNEQGAVYYVLHSPNPDCNFQLIIDSIGIYMSLSNLKHLLKVVQKPYEPCQCEKCGGEKGKIWYVNPTIDLCLKVDVEILKGLEDLLKGTFFYLEMENTLRKNKGAIDK